MEGADIAAGAEAALAFSCDDDACNGRIGFELVERGSGEWPVLVVRAIA